MSPLPYVPHWRVALDPGALWSDSAFQACGGLDAAQILDIYLSEDADWLDDVEGEEVVTVNVLEEAAGTYHEYTVTCQPGVALSWALVASHTLDPL